MEQQPKKLITRILEFTVLFALSAFLLRLGVCYITQIWPVLLVIAATFAAGFIGWRIWKSRSGW